MKENRSISKCFVMVLVIALMIGAFLPFVGRVGAPPIFFNVYGTGAYEGDIPIGSYIGADREITAWIDGVAYELNFTKGISGQYDLEIPADDWGLAEYEVVKEGGYHDDLTYYFLDYDPMYYYLSVGHITSYFEEIPWGDGFEDLAERQFFNNTDLHPGWTTLRNVKINEIVLSPSDPYPQYVYLYDFGGELSEAILEDPNEGYYLQKDDPFPTDPPDPSGQIFEFSANPQYVENFPVGSNYYYINLTGFTLDPADELKLVWKNPWGPLGSGEIGNGTDIIVDRVEWGNQANYFNDPGGAPPVRDYDNTSMPDFMDLPLPGGASMVRSSDKDPNTWSGNGTDTDDCDADFKLKTVGMTRPAAIPPVLEPFINIEKAVAQSTVYPGDTINYVIWYNNTGLGNSPVVWVNETFDANVQFVSSFPAPTVSADPFYSWEFADVPPGDNFITVQVTADVGLADGTIIQNFARLEYFNSSYEIRWANSNTVNTVVQSSVMTIEKGVDVTTVAPSGFITYTIWFNNTGSGPAAAAWINDTFDIANTDFDSRSSSDPIAYENTMGSPLIFRFDDVAPGSHWLQIVVQVHDPLPDGTLINNTAQLEYTDPNGNFIATLTTPQVQTVVSVPTTPVLSIEKEVDSPTVVSGDLITYRIWFNNSVPANSLVVWINDTYDTDSTYISRASLDPITSEDTSGNPLLFEFSNIGIGAHWLDITVQVNSGLTNGTLIDNFAHLNYTDQFGNDMPGMNSNTVTSTVLAPIMEIWKVVENSTTPVGGLNTYTIYYNNTGGAPAPTVWVNDTFHQNLTVVYANPTWTTNVGDFYSWEFTNVAPGSYSITVVVRVDVDPALAGAIIDNQALLGWTDVEGISQPDIPSNTPTFVVGQLTIDEIRLTDAMGNPIPSQSITADDEIIIYARGYNSTTNTYLGDVDVSWVVVGLIGVLNASTGTWVVFNATTVGAGYVEATYLLLYNRTGDITVTAGAPYRIEYFSGDGQIEFPSTMLAPFEVRVTDFDGNPVSGVEVIWEYWQWPAGDQGSLSWLSSFTDAAGIAYVTYTLGGDAGDYWVNGTNSTLVGDPINFHAVASLWTIDYIVIIDEATGLTVPDGYTMSSDDELKLIAYAFNSSGGGNLGLVAVNWSVNGGIGGLTNSTPNRQAKTTFDAQVVGTGSIRAEFDDGTVFIWNVTGNINVIVGAVFTIVLTPASVTRTTDDSDIFRAVGYDEDGNVNWTWSSNWRWLSGVTGLGTITPIDEYNVTVDYNLVGIDTLRVEVLGTPSINDDAAVTVTPGIVVSITLWPASVTNTTDGSDIFRAIGYDADGNENWTWSSNWRWLSGVTGLGTITPIDEYNVTVDYNLVGTDTIRVEVLGTPGINDDSAVTVTPGAVVRIELIPYPSTIGTVSQIQIFRAVGYDADNNENWTWMPTWSWQINPPTGVGTIIAVPDPYNASVTYGPAGDDTIRVADSTAPGIYNETDVHVSAAIVLARIELTPWPSVTGDTDGSQIFRAKGINTDGFDNWSWTPNWGWLGSGLGSIVPLDLYNITVAYDTTGRDTIRVRDVDNPTISNQTDVYVNAGAVVSITLSPASVSVTTDDSDIFQAVGRDADNNINWSWDSDWSWVTTALGTMTQLTPGDLYNMTVDYDTPGLDWLHVEVSGDSTIFDNSTVDVSVGAPFRMGYVSGRGQLPHMVNMALSDPFVVNVTDQDWNPVEGVEVNWTIDNFPVGATGQSIALHTFTNANGEANATLTLGSLEGLYYVNATNDTVDPIGVWFIAEAKILTVDAIRIVDEDGTEVTTLNLNVGETFTVYGELLNITDGTTILMGHVPASATWGSDDTDLATVSPAAGNSTVITCPGDAWSDTATITLTVSADVDVSEGVTLPLIATVDVVVGEPAVESIEIVDAAGNAITTVNLEKGDTLILYARGYNATASEFWKYVDVDWDTNVTGVGTFNVTTATDTVTFTAGTVTADTAFHITAEYTTDITAETVGLFVMAPPPLKIDSIKIRDAANGGGNEVTSATLNEDATATYYAAAYNGTTYLYDVAAEWSVTGGIGAVNPTNGTSTTFTAGDHGTGTVVASYGGLTADVDVTVNDVLPPSPPTEVTAEEGEEPGEIDITWNPSSSDDVASYEIYRNGELIDTVPATQGSYTDEDLDEDTEYSYYVIAVDDAGNPSDPSPTVTSYPKGKEEEPFPWWIIILIIVIIIVLLLLFLFMRKGKERCPQCNAPVEKGALVCGSCGYALKEGVAPPAEEEAPAEEAPLEEEPTEEEAYEEEAPAEEEAYEEEPTEEEPYEEEPAGEEPYEEEPTEEGAPPEEEPPAEEEPPEGEEEPRRVPPPPPPK